MELFIEVALVQSLHLRIDIIEEIVCPVDDCIKIGFDFLDVVILAMSTHIAIYMTLAHPFQGRC